MTTPTATPATSPRPGLFARVRTLVAGTRDPVDAQLAEIERQGAALARLAHGAAFCLIVLFSIGSLLGLSHDALITLQQQWQATHTVNLTSALAAAVNGFLVLVMDTALIYSASILRIIKARQGEGGAVHILVMIGVSVIEGATWAYFSSIYDLPHDPVAWALIGARAVAAPLLSAYLSLARAIPIGPRDILYQAAMASGKGVIRDVTREANDQSAPLARKMAIYGAAALMHPTDRQRLDRMIAAVEQHQTDQQPQQPSEPPRTPHPIAQIPAPSEPPVVLPFAGRSDHISPAHDDHPEPGPAQDPASADFTGSRADARDHRAFTLNLISPHARPQPSRPAPTREEIQRRRLRAAERILAQKPDMGLRELTRQIAIATHYRVSESTVAKIATRIRSAGGSPALHASEHQHQHQQPDSDLDPDPNPAA